MIVDIERFLCEDSNNDDESFIQEFAKQFHKSYSYTDVRGKKLVLLRAMYESGCFDFMVIGYHSDMVGKRWMRLFDTYTGNFMIWFCVVSDKITDELALAIYDACVDQDAFLGHLPAHISSAVRSGIF